MFQFKTRQHLNCASCRAQINCLVPDGAHISCRKCGAASRHTVRAGRKQWRADHACSGRTPDRSEDSNLMRDELLARVWEVNPELAAEMERGYDRAERRERTPE